MMPSEPILTPRLRLRPFADDLSDLDELHAIQSDPEHMRFYPHPFSRDESRAWIERAFVREAMGWTFPWYSSAGSEFNFDTGLVHPR